ncbi:hypothetical protein PVAND_008779 [Polypedilum vanderplanki]|uniref:NTF2 domain-containing protein n=1 Tax=Polypedilum vanderplanki TaxID=319348 RepID=A0A9J6CBE7_POLVA|nr:hypothetical protein PVAND_008779 [Polypedilum vanderplanki]
MLFNLLLFVLSPTLISCDRNTNYNQSGNVFIQQYYQQLDNTYLRPNLKNLYDITDSTFSYNGEIFYGSNNIMTRIQQIPKIFNRTLIVVDHQPKLDEGIITNIFGKIQIDNGTILTIFFSEMFLLQWRGFFYIQHQYLRIHSKTSTVNNDSIWQNCSINKRLNFFFTSKIKIIPTATYQSGQRAPLVGTDHRHWLPFNLLNQVKFNKIYGYKLLTIG